MSEYICREEAIAAFREEKEVLVELRETKEVLAALRFADILIEMFEELPAADVAPVVRGHWVDNCADKYYVRCFVCANIGYRSFKYCPHCGAKMDKEAEEK